MKEPVWLLKQVVLACHAEAPHRHGGADGVRDENLLESALARPRQLLAYEQADLCSLAAAYAHGIVRNHPFVDGNKRAAFLAAAVFLQRNGCPLSAHPAHAAAFVIALADGSLSEAGFAAWLRDHVRRPRRARRVRAAKRGRQQRPR